MMKNCNIKAVGSQGDLVETHWKHLEDEAAFKVGCEGFSESSALSRTDPCMLSKTSPPLLESR
jgi:hypothetical protein